MILHLQEGAKKEGENEEEEEEEEEVEEEVEDLSDDDYNQVLIQEFSFWFYLFTIISLSYTLNKFWPYQLCNNIVSEYLYTW